MKRKNRIEEYCETTFNCLKANVHNWGKPEYNRPISRIYYCGVFDCGNPNPTGLISAKALKNKKNKLKTVCDHYLSPQFVGRMILDNPQIYLEDYLQFRKLFVKCTHTIVVTQEENENLSELTKNTKGEYIVKVPTNLKYNHLGIKLYKRDEGVKGWKRENCTILENNILNDVPVELLDYERDYLLI